MAKAEPERAAFREEGRVLKEGAEWGDDRGRVRALGLDHCQARGNLRWRGEGMRVLDAEQVVLDADTVSGGDLHDSVFDVTPESPECNARGRWCGRHERGRIEAPYSGALTKGEFAALVRGGEDENEGPEDGGVTRAVLERSGERVLSYER